MPGKRRAALFDFDGTLADSLPSLFRAFSAFMTRHGRIPNRQTFDLFNGPPLADIVHRIAQSYQLDGDFDALFASYQRYIDEFRDDVVPLLGAKEILTLAHQNEWEIGIVTSRRRQEVEAFLARWNWAPLISVIVGGEDIKHGKPDPEPYVTALRLMACDPIHALAIEDSLTGARSAMSAAIKTILIGGSDPSDLEKSEFFVGRLSRLGDIEPYL